MVAQPEQRLTPKEYLARERAAETKSEYVDGILLAMSGASRAHILIAVNITRELGNQLLDRPCELYNQDMRVRIAEGHMYAYPDVTVVCDTPEFEDDELDVLLNSTLILEVLSPSTEGYDRGLKFERYRQRASLQEYVLVAQDRISVARYSRQGESWVFTAVADLNAVVELPSIGCTLAVRSVYRKVQGLAADG